MGYVPSTLESQSTRGSNVKGERQHKTLFEALGRKSGPTQRVGDGGDPIAPLPDAGERDFAREFAEAYAPTAQENCSEGFDVRDACQPFDVRDSSQPFDVDDQSQPQEEREQEIPEGYTYETHPGPCECGKGTWRQTGYDPNYNGAEFTEFECTGCGKMTSITGASRWSAGRI